MKVSGQIHAPVALSPGKQPPVPTVLTAGWAPEPVRTLWRLEKKTFALPVIEPRLLGSPARNLFDIHTGLSRLLQADNISTNPYININRDIPLAGFL
jgi:hypothetical protein